MQFQKDKGKDVLALLDSRRKVNVMTLAYVAQLGLKVQKANVNAHTLNGFSLKIYGIVITAFKVFNKISYFRFFQETFLLTDISMEVILGIDFLTLSNADV